MILAYRGRFAYILGMAKQPKSESIRVRVTPEEKAACEKSAEAARLSLSSWAAMKLCEAVKREKGKRN